MAGIDRAFSAFSNGEKQCPVSDRTARHTFRLLVKGDSVTMAKFDAWKSQPRTPTPEPPAQVEPLVPDAVDPIRDGTSQIHSWARAEHSLVDVWCKAEHDRIDADARLRHDEIRQLAALQRLGLYPQEVVDAAFRNFSEHLGHEVSAAELLESSAGVIGWGYMSDQGPPLPSN